MKSGAKAGALVKKTTNVEEEKVIEAKRPTTS